MCANADVSQLLFIHHVQIFWCVDCSSTSFCIAIATAFWHEGQDKFCAFGQNCSGIFLPVSFFYATLENYYYFTFHYYHGSIFHQFSYALYWLSEKVVKSKKVNSKSCHKFSLRLWRTEIFKSSGRFMIETGSGSGSFIQFTLFI